MSYGNGVVLEGIAIDLEPGTIDIFMGTSGSGKPTMLHALSGVLPRIAQICGTTVLRTGTERMDLQYSDTDLEENLSVRQEQAVDVGREHFAWQVR